MFQPRAFQNPVWERTVRSNWSLFCSKSELPPGSPHQWQAATRSWRLHEQQTTRLEAEQGRVFALALPFLFCGSLKKIFEQLSLEMRGFLTLSTLSRNYGNVS